jgi:hypothetical protein
MSGFQTKRPLRCGLVTCLSSLSLFAGCAAVDPSRPGDAAMSCNQIIAEIGQQDEAAQLAERRASELRPSYYAYSAATLIPLVGNVFGMVDQFSDASHSRELDHLNEDARDAQHRRDYLKSIQAAHCTGLPMTPVVPSAQAANNRPDTAANLH